eukprot:7327662-Prymnesium_polylepis.1
MLNFNDVFPREDRSEKTMSEPCTAGMCTRRGGRLERSWRWTRCLLPCLVQTRLLRIRKMGKARAMTEAPRPQQSAGGH